MCNSCLIICEEDKGKFSSSLRNCQEYHIEEDGVDDNDGSDV